MINSLCLTGRLVAAPEFSKNRATFTIVDNSFGKPQFVYCVIFDESLIKLVRNWLKGFMVTIVGRLQIQQVGKIKYTSVIVDRLRLLIGEILLDKDEEAMRIKIEEDEKKNLIEEMSNNITSDM